MPRPICRRRLVYVAFLAALAILPNVVHVYGALRYVPATKGGVVYLPTPDRESPVVHIMFLDRTWFDVEASSVERAKSFGYRWEQYRRWSWVFAAVAACVLIWPLLPIRAVFGPEDESCD
jgi:hypothetical protein